MSATESEQLAALDRQATRIIAHDYRGSAIDKQHDEWALERHRDMQRALDVGAEVYKVCHDGEIVAGTICDVRVGRCNDRGDFEEDANGHLIRWYASGFPDRPNETLAQFDEWRWFVSRAAAARNAVRQLRDQVSDHHGAIDRINAKIRQLEML